MPAPTALSPSPLGDPVVPKARDADATRQLLLHAARRRFARDGYVATTVRDIAGDAGVNVALINRYFTSKEGLFEACLNHVAEEVGRTDDEATVERVLKRMVSQVTATSSGEYPLDLMLLLRSSGDERADGIRQRTLRSFAERLAAAVGWRSDDPSTERLLLRAQLALATALGIVMLQSSTGLEPLSSASEEDLSVPLGEVLATLLR